MPACCCPSSRRQAGRAGGSGRLADLPLVRLVEKRGPGLPAGAAAPRDGRRRSLAVFGDLGDGHRPPLHFRQRGSGFPGAGWRSLAPPGRAAAVAAVRASRPCPLPRRFDAENGGAPDPFRRFQLAEWPAGSRRARQPCAPTSTLASVGRRLHACFARCTSSPASGPWWDWAPALVATRTAALGRHAWRSPTNCCTTRTFNGSRTSNGTTRGERPPRSSSSATCRSWSAATAPTSGPISTRFAATPASGLHPDAFTPTARTGISRCIGGMCLPPSIDAWIRARAKRTAALFDGYRIDHVVGFYRTYRHPGRRQRAGVLAGGRDRPARAGRAGHERVSRRRRHGHRRGPRNRAGFRPRLAAPAGIPGYKVFRWEREWDTAGLNRFEDPQEYHATLGRNDRHSRHRDADGWWEATSFRSGPRCRDCRSLARRRPSLTAPECDAATRDLLLETLVASSSDLLILPVQDVFGWRDRINVPAHVSERIGRGGCPGLSTCSAPIPRRALGQKRWPAGCDSTSERRCRPTTTADSVDPVVLAFVRVSLPHRALPAGYGDQQWRRRPGARAKRDVRGCAAPRNRHAPAPP